MNLKIDMATAFYIKDAIIILFVVGCTIYNIMQDRRIQELKDENDRLSERIGGYVDSFDILFNDIYDDHEALFSDYCELYDRVRKCEKKVKEMHK